MSVPPESSAATMSPATSAVISGNSQIEPNVRRTSGAASPESRTYWQVIPYTDRLNYCSSFMNGHGWALAC